MAASVLFGAPSAGAQAKQSPSKAVAKPLQAAQTAMKSNKWGECISNVRQADAAAGKTPYDDYAINEILGFCAIRSNDFATAARAYEANLNSEFFDKSQTATRVRALSQIYYQLKNYDKAVDYGMRAVRGGFANDDLYVLVAQAIYLQGDNKGTLKFVGDWVDAEEKRGQTPRENALQLMLSACIKLEDDMCTTRSLERLVTHHPKDEYWQNLMRSLFRAGGSDQTMLQVYRLANQVNAMRRGEDYTEMAQLAIERGFPGEAQAVLEAAFSRKVFTDQRDIDRNNRLLATAKTQATNDRSTLARQEKDVAAAKTGDADVKIGIAYMSYNMLPQAIAAIQRGIQKGSLRNPAEAQLALGMAQLRSGNREEAVKAFRSAKGDETLVRLANLWALHAQRS